MTRTAAHRLVTPRDLEIFTALDHAPLTVQQLLKFSQTFAQPFTHPKRVHERLSILIESGRVRRWPYATAGRSSEKYYVLTPLGYRLLHGPEAAPPTKRYFTPVAVARQHHTRSLADFIVHTAWAASRAGVTFTGFARENAFALKVGEETLYPDCGFQLIPAGGPDFGFFAEVDNSTERIRSAHDLDSWERKIRLYDAFQDSSPTRFRVLIVTTRSAERVHRILEAVAALVKNPQRSLFYGVHLPAYLAREDAVLSPGFRDHCGKAVALVPSRSRGKPPVPLATTLAVA